MTSIMDEEKLKSERSGERLQDLAGKFCPIKSKGVQHNVSLPLHSDKCHFIFGKESFEIIYYGLVFLML